MSRLGAIVALAAAGAAAAAAGAADLVVRGAKAVMRPVTAMADPYQAELDALRKARKFVAADGSRYRVGPCGYVPRSAQLDPARRKNRRGARSQRRGRGR